MSDKSDQSPTAIALRRFAIEYGEHINDEPTDSTDREGRERWKKLKRAAIAYARVQLAGQCIPF